MSRSLTACRCLEIALLVVIIIAVWLLMFLPVLVYFLPQNNDPQSDQTQNSTTAINLNLQGENDSTSGVCPKDFFADPDSGGQCKPQCSSWMMYSRPLEIVSLTVISSTTVIGILTTAVIIILSFVHFKSMLEFPSVLILYQDIIVSIHGISVLTGFANRGLFCASKDLVETYNSPASPYCTLSGIVSNYMALSLTVWITIQVSYTILSIYTPVYIMQLKEKKWKKDILHFLSLLAGIVSLLIPSMVTLGLGGYSSLDTKFPPVVCFAKNRDITAYMLLIPMGVLMALIITELILIFRFLMRNRCGKNKSKDLKQAEIKVIVICCCYVVLGLGASLALAISSTSLRELKIELLEYFECERTAGSVSSLGQSCNRSEFEGFLNPSSKILGYSLVALYPVITLIYFAHKKRKPHLKRTLTHSGASSKSLTLTGL